VFRNSFVSLSADEVMKDHQAGNIAVHSNMPKFSFYFYNYHVCFGALYLHNTEYLGLPILTGRHRAKERNGVVTLEPDALGSPALPGGNSLPRVLADGRGVAVDGCRPAPNRRRLAGHSGLGPAHTGQCHFRPCPSGPPAAPKGSAAARRVHVRASTL